MCTILQIHEQNIRSYSNMEKWVGNYYLKADDSMAENEWIGNYCVGADGKWIPNYLEVSSTVYWTLGGKSYHNSKDCPTLKQSTDIKSGTLADAKAKGKTDPCNICVK